MKSLTGNEMNTLYVHYIWGLGLGMLNFFSYKLMIIAPSLGSISASKRFPRPGLWWESEENLYFHFRYLKGSLNFISLLISSLTYWFFSDMLFNLHIFMNCPDILV